MKVWVIGAGGGGAYEDECNGRSDGGYGGEAVRTYSVTGGTISYSIGAAGLLGPRTTGGLPGGTTTLTYNSITITATGGEGGTTDNTAPADGVGSGGDFNRVFNFGGVLDFQGRVAAVTLSGSSLNAGFKGIGTYLQSTSTDGSPGAIVIYFTQ
jgi:hypothetical protein